MDRADAAAPEHFPGEPFLTRTPLTPLLANPTVQEAIKLCHAGGAVDMLVFGTLRLDDFSVYFRLQNAPIQATIGAAMMPGSEKVWFREIPADGCVQQVILPPRHGVS